MPEALSAMRNCTVAILESRAGAQLAELVTRRGGRPLLAPALAEVADFDAGSIADFVKDRKSVV